MGKSVKERLTETIKRDKREINEEGNKMVEKEEKETNVEDFMNEKIKEMIEDKEEELEDKEEKLDVDEEEFEDDLDDRSSNGKKIVIMLLVLIISLSTILVLWSNGYEIVNFAFNKVNEISEAKEAEENKEAVENENITITPVDLNECYQRVHYMVNTIIIAEDGNIWGESEMSRDAVTQLINDLKGQDDYLSNELEKWLELDFSNGVEVHNYVWSKLGGTIGKAKDLNQEKVQRAIEIMGE
ncbi:DUF6241 domain-containing protein [Clostridium sp. D53t1_180928_C8]|uniref:DUF6241 domain-containing protein n=1 Tax=Clostridium sp. D53t1_180928_C8 TaxID=2787101 RepID=UPI0018A9B28F|nr:DUF6241 domain-containing protein [Clostridium sp. D53t1_180928_C8]